jgi:hypothetical protein
MFSTMALYACHENIGAITLKNISRRIELNLCGEAAHEKT